MSKMCCQDPVCSRRSKHTRWMERIRNLFLSERFTFWCPEGTTWKFRGTLQPTIVPAHLVPVAWGFLQLLTNLTSAQRRYIKEESGGVSPGPSFSLGMAVFTRMPWSARRCRPSVVLSASCVTVCRSCSRQCLAQSGREGVAAGRAFPDGRVAPFLLARLFV